MTMTVEQAIETVQGVLAELTATQQDAEVGLMAAPPHVAAGELITSAWGNAVVDYIRVNPGVVLGGAGIFTDQILMQTNTTVVTTNVSANATIPFNPPYGTAPIVLATVGYYNPGYIVMVDQTTVTTAGFTVAVIDHTGTGVANSAIRINWFAIGTR